MFQPVLAFLIISLTFSSSSISESFLSIARLSRFSNSDMEFLPGCCKKTCKKLCSIEVSKITWSYTSIKELTSWVIKNTKPNLKLQHYLNSLVAQQYKSETEILQYLLRSKRRNNKVHKTKEWAKPSNKE